MCLYPPGVETTARLSRDCQRQGGRRARLDDRPNPGELPQASSIVNEPKTLTGSNQNGVQSGDLFSVSKRTDDTTAGVEAGAKSSAWFKRNMVNPTFRLIGGRHAARGVVGMAGRGTLEKAKATL